MDAMRIAHRKPSRHSVTISISSASLSDRLRAARNGVQAIYRQHTNQNWKTKPHRLKRAPTSTDMRRKLVTITQRLKCIFDTALVIPINGNVHTSTSVFIDSSKPVYTHKPSCIVCHNIDCTSITLNMGLTCSMCVALVKLVCMWLRSSMSALAVFSMSCISIEYCWRRAFSLDAAAGQEHTKIKRLESRQMNK